MPTHVVLTCSRLSLSAVNAIIEKWSSQNSSSEAAETPRFEPSLHQIIVHSTCMADHAPGSAPTASYLRQERKSPTFHSLVLMNKILTNRCLVFFPLRPQARLPKGRRSRWVSSGPWDPWHPPQQHRCRSTRSPERGPVERVLVVRAEGICGTQAA